MKNRANKIQKAITVLRKEDNEQGVIAVIVALVLVALMGFASLAIDESSWLVKQRQYQNAADAIALDACDKKYRSKNKGLYSEEKIREDGIELAKKNGLEFDKPEQLKIEYTDSEKKATVTISKPTDNYFMTAVNGETKTNITVTSDAQIGSSNTPGSDFSYGSAVESGSYIKWHNGQNTSDITGGVSCIGDFTSTSNQSGTNKDFNGDLWANGNVTLSNITKFEGDIKTQGNFNATGAIPFNGDIYANGTVTNENDSATYKNVYCENIGKFNQKPDSKVNFVKENPNVKAYNWHSTWDKLDQDIRKRINNNEYFVVNKELIEKYNKDHSDNTCSWKTISDWRFGNCDGMYFDDNFNFNKFCNDLKDYNNNAVPSTIYIDGGIQSNNNKSFTIPCNVIAKNNILDLVKNLNGNTVEIDGSLISLEGSIKLQGGKIGNDTSSGGLVALGGKIQSENNLLDVTGALSARDGIYVIQGLKVKGNKTWTAKIDPSNNRETVRLSK